VRQEGETAICGRERALTRLAAEGLRQIPGVRVFVSEVTGAQTGVLSFLCENADAEIVGAALAERGIAVRSGLHCAPLAHRSAGTLKTGTVRMSVSAFNTEEEISEFVSAMVQIVHENS